MTGKQEGERYREMMTGNRSAMVAVLSLTVALLGMSSFAGEPGEGIDIGRLLVHPYIRAEATYDSNPHLTAEEEDDFFLEGEVGLDFTLPTKLFLLDGLVYVGRRDYLQEDAESPRDRRQNAVGNRGPDATDFGEMLGLRAGDRGSLALSIRQTFQRAQDYSRRPSNDSLLSEYITDAFVSEDSTERARRDMLSAAVALGRDLTDKIEADIGYGFRDVDYDSDALLDYEENGIDCELGYGITDKSAVFAMGRYRVLDAEALDEDEDTVTAQLGWKTRFTVKSTFKAGVGVEHTSDEDELSFDLAWMWRPTDRLSVGVTGSKSIEPSSYDRGYTRDLILAGLSASYAMTDSLASWIGLSYRGEDAEAVEPVVPVPGQPASDPRESDIVGVVAGLDLSPSQWLSLYLRASHESTDSNYPEGDYDETRITVGAKAMY